MMREWPYTASNQDELGCTSPATSRFLGPQEISWLSGMYNPIHPSSRQCTYTFSPHFFHSEISREVLILTLPSRCLSGFALGTSLGLREISWLSEMYNPLCLSSPQCTDTIQCLTYEMRATLLGCTLQIYVLAGPDVGQNHNNNHFMLQ